MRPLQIDVQGFTAFRDRQEVDLSEFGLFVITGPTGSGKTSLLDAMIFALYGRVPRAGRHGMKDLISQGIAEARVKLEFSVDDQRYRVSRRLSHSQAQSATLEHFEDDQWRSAVDGSGIRVVDARVVELLKLHYEAFTRAVVLPQGEFHQFLRGDRDERRKILTGLLGLDHYEEMGRRARARAKDRETAIEATDQILAEQYADVSEAAKKQLEEDAAQAERRATELGEALKQAEGLEAQRGTLTSTVDKLGERSEQIEEITSKLGDERAGYEEAQRWQAQLAKDHSEAEEVLKKRDNDARTAEKRLAGAIKKYGTLEKLTRQENAVETAAEAERERTEQEARLDTLGRELGDAEDAAVTAKSEETRTAEAVSQAEKREATSRDEVEGGKGEIGHLTARLGDAENAFKEHREAVTNADKAAKSLATAERKAEPAAKKLANAEESLAELRHRHEVAVVAAGLEPGDPCPVCQRPLDQHPDVDPTAEAALKEADARLQVAREAYQTAENALATAQERDRTAKQQLTKAERRLAQALGDAGDVDALRQEATSAACRAEEAAKRLAAASATLSEARKAHQKATATAAEAKGAVKACKDGARLVKDAMTRAERRRDSATKLLIAHFGKDVPDDAGQRLKAERLVVEEAQSALADAQQQTGEARDHRDSLAKGLAESQQQLSAVDERIAGLRAHCEAVGAQLAAELGSLDGKLTAPVLEAQPRTRDEHVDQLHNWCDGGAAIIVKAVRAAEKAGEKLERQLDRLVAEHKVAAASGRDGAAVLRETTEAALEARGKLREQAQQMAKRLGQRKELEERTAAQREEVEVLSALSAELRANRFVGFILQETLDLLALRASDELMRISDERYGLVSEEGDFAVVDHINADERRSVNTLSGGETFLASLALALALSQHVGDLATEGMGAKLKAVFIDEGFGTLDPETLEDVIDALERLQEGELMVGVITHVPALAERIKVGVQIEKDQGKSTVRVADAA
jgi:DNA repair protein SbcC/Rad50